MTSFHLSRRFVRWCFELWRSTQVELHGQYGIEHLNALHIYETRTHWSRVALVCLFIPLPATITIILLDLIPLEPIEKGPNAIGVWTRLVLTGTVVSTSAMYQLRPYVPWMELTTCLMWTIGFAATIIAVVALWQLSLVVGYPLPFITIVSVPVISTVMTTALFCFRNKRIRKQKDLVREMLPPVNVISCQVFMMVIYPLYNHILAQLASLKQTAFVLLLPVIKIVCRLWINRSIRDSRDASPEVIIFNVEVFHSLFVANCMQSSTTTRTVLVLVLMDFLQACISWWDVRTLLQEIQQLMSTTGPESTKNLLSLVQDVVNAEPQLYTPDTFISEHRIASKAHLSIRKNEVRPIGTVTPATLAHLTADQRQSFVNKVLQMLYLTEFVVLVEYTEVIMPLIYSIYVAALSGRPNHEYYRFLDNWSTSSYASMLTNVSVYTMAELVSLILMAVILWRHLHVSIAHQLAFNLETRFAHVQGKLVGWEVYVVQNALVQSGTHRICWLTSTEADPTPLDHDQEQITRFSFNGFVQKGSLPV